MCQAEPPALTDEQVVADADGSADRAFNDAALLAGRSCRDALRRVCEWHKARGAKDLNCNVSALSLRQLRRLVEHLTGGVHQLDGLAYRPGADRHTEQQNNQQFHARLRFPLSGSAPQQLTG